MIGTLAAAVLAGSWAFASQRDDRDDATPAASGPPAISLSQAIAIAEPAGPDSLIALVCRCYEEAVPLRVPLPAATERLNHATS